MFFVEQTLRSGRASLCLEGTANTCCITALVSPTRGAQQEGQGICCKPWDLHGDISACSDFYVENLKQEDYWKRCTFLLNSVFFIAVFFFKKKPCCINSYIVITYSDFMLTSVFNWSSRKC